MNLTRQSVSAEEAQEIASFSDVSELELRYDNEEFCLNLRMLLRSDAKDRPEPVELHFLGVRQFRSCADFLPLETEEVTVRDVSQDELEGVRYSVYCERGNFEFGFFCGKIERA